MLLYFDNSFTLQDFSGLSADVRKLQEREWVSDKFVYLHLMMG